MKEYQKSIIPHIESLYESFTPSEKSIADFFIHNTEESDISSKALSKKLFVSEASISRFAKSVDLMDIDNLLLFIKKVLKKLLPILQQVIQSKYWILMKSF